jgi:riboflavin kinase/FMN adenylyltransferase
VYYSTVLVDGKEYLGLTNVGVKPTVGSDSVLLETYIYDFDRDIYGQTVTVSLREFKRPEKKFESVEELKKALANDIEEGKNNQKAIHI